MKYFLALIVTSTIALGASSDALMRDYDTFTAKGFKMSPKGEANSVATQLGGNIAKITDRVIDGLVDHVASELQSRGYSEEANRIIGEWRMFSGFLETLDGTRDVGDHPAIKWLFDVHARIHTLLGDELCHAVRAHDLWWLAYTIPVVFRCAGLTSTEIDAVEYALHFVPFAGIVTYWTVFIGCEVLTSGNPFCGLGASLAERCMVTLVAPRLSSKVYPKVCK